MAAAGLREDEAVVHGHPSSVQVMTMHGAKGLEFDCVYVLGVQQSRMPGRRRSGELVPDALLKEELPSSTTRGTRRRDAAPSVCRHDPRPQAAGAGVAGGRRDTGPDPQKPSEYYQEARAAVGIEEEERREELLGIHEDLFAAFRMLRDDVMGSVAQVGARMGELRLDAHLDAAGAVARYMELLKLASLIERHPRARGAAGRAGRDQPC